MEVICLIIRKNFYSKINIAVQKKLLEPAKTMLFREIWVIFLRQISLKCIFKNEHIFGLCLENCHKLDKMFLQVSIYYTLYRIQS